MDDLENDRTIPTIRPPGFAPSHDIRRCPKCGLQVPDTTLVCPQDGTAVFKEPGTMLADAYEFVGVTGWGGMSVIYKAKMRRTGKMVAIKMLHSLLMTDQSLKRFQQEATAISSLHHPNIIAVHESGVSEHGQPYMVMDFIEGKNLGDVIKDKGALSLEESLPRFIQLCDALEHAHGVGVLHRDLKPSNIMISSTDGSFEDARIVDFGIAKLLDKTGEDKGNLTQTGELFGSPLYMSPEQCSGTTVDARTDIYSMGCVMYETLTGKPPFRGATVVETIVMQMHDKARPLSEANPNKRFSEQLENVIAKTLAKDPNDRYQTMTQLEMALMQIQPTLSGPDVRDTTRSEQFAHSLRQAVTQRVGSIPLSVKASVAGLLIILFVGVLWTKRALVHRPPNPVPVRAAAVNQSSILSPKQILAGFQSTELDDRLIQYCLKYDLLEEELKLEYARLTDRSAPFIATQRHLKKLDVDHTPITDKSLPDFGTMKKLEQLELRHTEITDDGLPYLLPLTNLQGLYLTGDHVGDKGIGVLKNLSSLRSLTLSSTNLTDEGLAQLKDLKLTSLHLNNANVTDAGLKALTGMVTLQELELRNAKVTNAGMEYLGKLPELKDLSVSYTLVNDAGLTDLAHCPKLQNFWARGTEITDAGTVTFEKFPSLDQLTLEHTSITDGAIPHLAKIKNLHSLTLSTNPISDKGAAVLSTMQNLSYLDLQGTDITDSGLKKLAELKNLKTLSISHCNGITHNGVDKIRKSLPNCKITVESQWDSG